MIKLSKTPMEGSAFTLSVSFKDSNGNYYVPISVTATFLAMNSDKTTWSVVGDFYKRSYTPKSSIQVTVDKLMAFEGTTLQRKILVEWVALVDGMVTDFCDEAEFEIKPRPYISNKPDEPIPPEIHLVFGDVEPQIGSIGAVPVNPVFYLRSNLPMDVSEGEVLIVEENEGEEISTSFTVDESKTKLTIAPNVSVDLGKTYRTIIKGFKSINGIAMKEPFEFVFHVDDHIQAQIDSLDERVTALEERPEPEPTVGNKLYCWTGDFGDCYSFEESPEVGDRMKVLIDNHFLDLPVFTVTEEGLEDGEGRIYVRNEDGDLDFTL